jgi:hypothetical protein
MNILSHFRVQFFSGYVLEETLTVQSNFCMYISSKLSYLCIMNKSDKVDIK